MRKLVDIKMWREICYGIDLKNEEVSELYQDNFPFPFQPNNPPKILATRHSLQVVMALMGMEKDV